MRSPAIRTVALLLLGVSPTFACAASLEQLVSGGKHDAAYRQGLAQLEQREGEPGFDLAFGIAALESGHLGEAVFALERVVTQEPGNVVARIGLGRAYLGLGSDSEARAQLQRAMAAAPSAAQRKEIRWYLDMIDARSGRRDVFQAWVEFDAGYDDNVNLSPDANRFQEKFNCCVATNVAIPLSDDAKQSAAWFHRTRLGVAMVRRLDAGRAVDAIARVGKKQNLGEDNFDHADWRLSVGFSDDYRDGRYRIAARYEQDDQDDDRLRYLWGVLGQYTVTGSADWNRGWQQTFLAGLTRIDYISGLSNRDVDQYLVGVDARKRIGELRHRVRAYYGYEDAQDTVTFGADPLSGAHGKADHNGRQFLALGWRFDYLDLGSSASWFRQHLPVLGDHVAAITPYADLTYSYAIHNDDLQIASETRADHVYELELGFEWDWSKELTVRGHYGRRRSESTVSLYRYDRNLVQLGVRYDFR